MTFRELDTVVLVRDVPEHELRAGDMGAVVEVLGGGDLTVEFVRASGTTHAVIDLRITDLRHATDHDVPAARPR